MTLAVVLLALLTLIALLFAFGASSLLHQERNRRGKLLELARRRVIVHTDDEGSIRGIVEDVAEDCYVLSNPEYLDHRGANALGGPAYVDRRRVVWVQIAREAEAGG